MLTGTPVAGVRRTPPRVWKPDRTAKQDDLAGVTSNYTYDKIYELTQVMQGVNTTESYSYDPVGNRLSSLGASYTVNTSNEVTAAGGVMYTYDSNGNTTSKTDSTGTTSYSWDYENRLTQVTLPGQGGTVQFKYDPFGRRIEKIAPSGTTIFAYDGDNVTETTNQSGGILSRFAQGQNIDEPLAESNSSGTYFYEQDGLGSVTSLTNGTGQLAQTYTYDSFGNTTHSTGSLTNPFQYTGREFDTETGLYYYRARYYDPSIGRFISEDPVRLISSYAYVRNNPITGIDPLGLCDLSPNQKCKIQCDIAYAIKLTICALLFESGLPALLCATGATVALRVCQMICDRKYPR